MHSDSKIIGVDLGTTNSVVAVIVGTEPEVIPNTEGSNKTPSVVAFLDNGEVVVGEIARRQAATNPTRTISSIKRLMGRSFEDVEESGESFTYKLVSHNGELLLDIDGMGYRPEQISALVLKKIKESAESYLNEDVTKAVITVPAYFDDLQRQATIESAKMAGLEVLRLINEPTAAAMAYGIGRATETDEIVAVYDFGGGTFDISILEISGKTFEVLTSTGDTRLGGDDLDNKIVEVVVAEFFEDHGVDLTQDPVTLRRLKEVAERAKCELSSTNQTVMALPFIAYVNNQPLHLERVMKRDEFEEMIEDFVRRTVRCCKRALEETKLQKKDIGKVILVGGTTRIPMVQESVEDFFDQKAFKGVNPDEVVALGAATQAGVFEGNVQEVILLDVTPHSLGIEVEGHKFSRIIEKNSTIPIKAAKTFTTTEENQEYVNIHVVQGENNDSRENRSLGKFTLQGLPKAPAGTPRVRVTFFINADGVMEISAEDMNTGAAQAITIVHTALSDEEKGKRSRKRTRAQRASGRRQSTTRSGSSGGGGATGVGLNVPPSPPKTTPPGARAGSDSSSGVTAGAGGKALKPPPSKVAVPTTAADTGTGAEGAADTGPQKFAVLGDTKPGDSSMTIKSRPVTSQTLDPVDYSKAPPMYAHMAQDQKEPSLPLPRAEGTNFPDSTQGGQFPVPPRPAAGPPSAVASHTAEAQNMPTPMEYDLGEIPQESVADVELPAEVASAVAMAQKSVDDAKALQVYQSAMDILGSADYRDSKAFSVLQARPLLNAMLGKSEETKEDLQALRASHGQRRPDQVLEVHESVLARFSTPVFLRERGLAREFANDIIGASTDIEQASRQDPQETDRAKLEELYRKRVEQTEDPAAQFKLVKILLKSNRVDEAIEVLTDLQRHRNYETRAVKILGLCHWQKNMHYLAWQKFKALPVDEDMKDILYRLACDMEAADQLNNAAAVLEQLIAHAPGYRDADARARKISYRIKLQKDEQSQSKEVPVLSKDSRFVILEEINRGSMGIIFKAQDKTLNEIVALKVLNDYLCSDPSAVERFKSEARAAKKLSHPYIIRIHDLFESDNKRFISMEYIEGTDLKRLLSEKTAFTEEMVLYYVMQICDALSYAHKLGVVHRDIKPANIMITSRNTVKIADFGIAKILRGEESTKSGTAVIGTPLYMAPEQIIGDPVDGRTDLYSLGIMLYEMVSGNPPFYLGNIEYHHIHTPPPPLPERVTPQLREVVYKMIAKKQADRYQSVEEVGLALRQIQPAV